MDKDNSKKSIPSSETGNADSAQQTKESKYQKIAFDVAGKIAAGEMKENETIYAKSSIASQYGVSNETARRALTILSDYGIVDITRGSGVKIISRGKAVALIRSNRDVKTFLELRKALEEEFAIQAESHRRTEEIFAQLQEKVQHFRSENPFMPYETFIPQGCMQAGKTLLETRFWNMTAATVVAIRRKGELMLSPGPDVTILEGDAIFYIGDGGSVERVNAFLGIEE